MSQPFHFRRFSIEQSLNPQKVGTDSMLLGAWSKGNFSHVLDIGTGTGILALMIAQQNRNAKVIAIEPEPDSLSEALHNFESSEFSHQITGVASSLQKFKAENKFDLIISNPPYFENSTLSKNQIKNKTRHTLELSISDLYSFASDHLSANGSINLIFPYDLEQNHFIEAAKSDLHPKSVLRTKRDDGTFKRTLVSYQFGHRPCVFSEMIVKHNTNKYSMEYIKMTSEFYLKDLNMEQQKNQ